MKFDGLEVRRCDDIKEIVAPEIDQKSFGTFEKQAPELIHRNSSYWYWFKFFIVSMTCRDWNTV